MTLNKYSFGIGDRFAHQGKAQLQAIINARSKGVNITPVWNKSYREHTITRTSPADVRAEADRAVGELEWTDSYYVDADHINLENVDMFIESSDFFTIDVANFISKPAEPHDINDFVRKHKSLCGNLHIAGLDEPLIITEDQIADTARNYLAAVKQAEKIYLHIENKKSHNNFITEISMDETDRPQRPLEILFILSAVADSGIPANTIAPKFIGSFYKGVDYVGDPKKFAMQFQQILAVISYATDTFPLPKNLKLSIHSGSDKFSIYPLINKALKKFDAGIHVKTAGTTWLEELIGLALAGPDGFAIAKKIYITAISRLDELCAPYAAVVDIDKEKLPSPHIVNRWTGRQFADALRHNQSCPQYNPNFRQILHLAYKIAAEMGLDFTNALKKHEKIIAENVTKNLYHRHIKPIFM